MHAQAGRCALVQQAAPQRTAAAAPSPSEAKIAKNTELTELLSVIQTCSTLITDMQALVGRPAQLLTLSPAPTVATKLQLQSVKPEARALLGQQEQQRGGHVGRQQRRRRTAQRVLMMAGDGGSSGGTSGTTTKVLMVCLGNICRSPSAEAVFKSGAFVLQTKNGTAAGLHEVTLAVKNSLSSLPLPLQWCKKRVSLTQLR